MDEAPARREIPRLGSVFDQALGPTLAAEARAAAASRLPLQRLTSADESGRRFLLRLLETRPSQQLLEEQEAIQKQLDDDHTIRPSTRTKLNEHLDWLGDQLALAAIRDEVQATRPEGCFCLGLGGRGFAAKPTTGDPNDPPIGWAEYCTCPEGVAAEEASHKYWADHQVEARAAKVRRVLGAADFGKYNGQTFDTYFELVERQVGSVPPICRSVVTLLKFWAQQDTKWLYLWGPFGTGKTAAAAILAVQLLERNPDLILTTVGDILEAIQHTFGVKPHNDDGLATTEQVTTAYREASLLIVDDLANENENATPFARQTFWRLLNDRYRAGRLTAFTSNCSPDELEDRIGWAASQRILENCLEVDMSGCPNLRKKASSKAERSVGR